MFGWLTRLFSFSAKAGNAGAQTLNATAKVTTPAGETIELVAKAVGTVEKVSTATSTVGKVAKVGTGVAVVGTAGYAVTSHVSSKIKEAAEERKVIDDYKEELKVQGITGEEFDKKLAARKQRMADEKKNPSLKSWNALTDFFSDPKKFGVGSMIGGSLAGAVGYYLGDTWLVGPAMFVGAVVGQPLMNAITGAGAPKTPQADTTKKEDPSKAKGHEQSLEVVAPKVGKTTSAERVTHSTIG